MAEQTVFSPELLSKSTTARRESPESINAFATNLLLTAFASESKTATMEYLDEVSAICVSSGPAGGASGFNEFPSVSPRGTQYTRGNNEHSLWIFFRKSAFN